MAAEECSISAGVQNSIVAAVGIAEVGVVFVTERALVGHEVARSSVVMVSVLIDLVKANTMAVDFDMMVVDAAAVEKSLHIGAGAVAVAAAAVVVAHIAPSSSGTLAQAP